MAGLLAELCKPASGIESLGVQVNDLTPPPPEYGLLFVLQETVGLVTCSVGKL